jgi:hypothetical protein
MEGNMVIDKAYLEARKGDLEKQLQRLQSDANAVSGAMQLITLQLAYLEKEPESTEKYLENVNGK